MSLPAVYRRDRERSIASYDWTDIAEGAGIVEFYLGGAFDSDGNNNYLMSTTPFKVGGEGANFDDSEGGSYSRINTNDTNEWHKKIPNDFDSKTFNRPRYINGTITAHLTGGGRINSLNWGIYVYFKVIIKKVDSTGTETTIATLQSKEIRLWDLEPDEKVQHFTIAKEANKTKIKVGEKIRTTVEAWVKPTNDGQNYQVAYFHDPMNNMHDPDFTVNETQARVEIPFEIDV